MELGIRMSKELAVRRLTAQDAEPLWKLRREALEREPASFGESLGEFQQTTVDTYRERINLGYGESIVIGAFEDLRLVAMAGLYREPREKQHHRGKVWGVYVSPEHRRKGVGRLVLTQLLEAGRALPGLDCAFLSVTLSQESARRLYLSLGFRPFGVEPRAVKVDGCYVDQEHMVLDFPPLAERT